MIIKINEQVMDRLLKEGFYPSEMFSMYFVIRALSENRVDLLDKYDDYNSSKRAVIIYQTLFRKGFIEKSDKDSNIYFKLTQTGIELVDSLNAVTEEPTKLVITSKSWIDSWLDLFPVKGGGRLLKSNALDCVKRMDTFIKIHKYSKDIILAATKSYLIEQSAESFRYTKNAIYFIDKKGEGSALAAWCKLVQDRIDSGGTIDDGNQVRLTQNVN